MSKTTKKVSSSVSSPVSVKGVKMSKVSPVTVSAQPMNVSNNDIVQLPIVSIIGYVGDRNPKTEPWSAKMVVKVGEKDLPASAFPQTGFGPLLDFRDPTIWTFGHVNQLVSRFSTRGLSTKEIDKYGSDPDVQLASRGAQEVVAFISSLRTLGQLQSIMVHPIGKDRYVLALGMMRTFATFLMRCQDLLDVPRDDKSSVWDIISTWTIRAEIEPSLERARHAQTQSNTQIRKLAPVDILIGIRQQVMDSLPKKTVIALNQAILGGAAGVYKYWDIATHDFSANIDGKKGKGFKSPESQARFLEILSNPDNQIKIDRLKLYCEQRSKDRKLSSQDLVDLLKGKLSVPAAKAKITGEREKRAIKIPSPDTLRDWWCGVTKVGDVDTLAITVPTSDQSRTLTDAAEKLEAIQAADSPVATVEQYVCLWKLIVSGFNGLLDEVETDDDDDNDDDDTGEVVE